MTNQEGWQYRNCKKTLKHHAKILAENRSTKWAIDKKVTKASDLKIGQFILINNHWKGQFDPTYLYDHQVAGIPNERTVLLTTPDGKERKCYIHHIIPVSSLDVTTSSNIEHPTGAFQQFWGRIQQDTSSGESPKHLYNIWSKTKRP